MRIHHQYIVKFVENIFTIWIPNTIKKVKTVLSSVWQAFRGNLSSFTHYFQNGACYWRLPISAFFQKRFSRTEVPDMQAHELELWNCFSYYPSITCFDYLVGEKCKYFGRDKKLYNVKYLFTIDWAHPDSNILDVEHSEIPQEHKCAHILELANGNFAAKPNNRILWHISSFTTGGNIPDYTVQTTEWNVENSGFMTDDTDKMFYDIKDKK